MSEKINDFKKEIQLPKIYSEFYPKNYSRKNEVQSNTKELMIHSSPKKVFKEYIPKHKRDTNTTNKNTPLNKDSMIFYSKSKFSKRNENKYDQINYEDDYSDDDYSGLASKINNDDQGQKLPSLKFKNNYRYSEDRNDFKTKWKTEICHYWEMYGTCKYGNSCAFAHGQEELNQRKMSLNYKTKPCKQFFELGICTYGSRCQFSHKLFREYDKDNNVSYLKILKEFNDSSNLISHEIIKRPRLMTFEDITNCAKEKKEKNRLELYEDILDIKKKGNEDRERVFSEDTNDATYENKNIKNENEEDKLSNCELTNEIYNLINDEDDNINHIEINLKKRERFVSI